MIVLYSIRKINIKEISKRKYNVRVRPKKDESFFIQQQNNHAFRQIKYIIQNQDYNNIYKTNLNIKKLKRKYRKSRNNKDEILELLKNEKDKLKQLQKIDEFIFVEAPKRNKKSLKKILREGFYYNNEKYIRFGKSASQAKNGITVFVKAKYYYEMFERSQLGVPIKKCVISKYEGYRNLILSACEFCEGDLPYIVMIDDYEKIIPQQYIRYVEKEDVEFTDKNTGEKKTIKNKKVVKETYMDVELTPFDGMGVHTEETGKKWSKSIGLKYLPISYQIRLPFMKGMSTEAPIKEVFEEWGITEITDMFGKVHQVKDIDCIWTKSMWKGCSIFKENFDNEAFVTYMKRLKKYNYCLGFSKYSHEVENLNLYSRSNFQYLQSLDLWNDKYVQYYNDKSKNKANEKFDFMKEENHGKIINIAKYSTDLIDRIVDEDKISTLKFLGVSNTGIHNAESNFMKAMLINDDMFYDVCIKKYIKRQLEKSINQMKYGKIYTKGFYHVAVGDIKGFLEYACGKDVRGCLKEKEFFATEMQKGECLSMRSPLVDPSEVNKIKIVSNEWTDKYLPYFKNTDVCMLNLYDISLPQQGGMDLDGDIIYLCQDSVMINSVIDKPIIVDTIDKVTADPVEYNLDNIIIYECNTRDNKIGEITNIATSIRNKVPYNENQERFFDDLVSMLRIYQGKEIDFVKTSYRWNIEKWMKKKFKQLPYFLLFNYPDTKLTTYKKIKKMNSSIKEKEDKVEYNSYHSPSPLNELCYYIQDWSKQKLEWGLNTKNTKDIVINHDIDYSNKNLLMNVGNIHNVFNTKFKEIMSKFDVLEDEFDILPDDKEKKTKELKSEISKLFDLAENNLYSLTKKYNTTLNIVGNYCIYHCYRTVARDKMFCWSMAGKYIIENLRKNTKNKKEFEIVRTKKEDKNSSEFLGKYYKLQEVDN
ncbi:hypothetical protein FCV38_10050 [Clostridium sporogenes]|nr:hypothetical protein [Clostridium sporogenes]